MWYIKGSNMINLTIEQLILEYRNHNCSLRETEKAFGASTNTLLRIFKKRKIDYNQIKKEHLKLLEEEYYKNPKRCLHCGKPFDYNDREKSRKQFCSRSCAASYTNTKRKISEETKYKISIALKNRETASKQHLYKTYYCKVCGKPFTMKDKRNVSGRIYCSAECKHQYLSEHTGGYRKGSGRGKKGWYKGIYCDSSWELAYVLYHLDKHIPIARCTESRKYVYQNKSYTYFPDFVVDGKIIEIKGYDSKQWQAKLLYNQDIIVLYELDMKMYLQYAHDTYGSNFIDLYDNSNPKNNDLNKTFVWLNNTKYNIFVTLKESAQFLEKGWIRGKIKGEIDKKTIIDFLKNHNKKESFEILGIKAKRLNTLIRKYNI